MAQGRVTLSAWTILLGMATILLVFCMSFLQLTNVGEPLRLSNTSNISMLDRYSELLRDDGNLAILECSIVVPSNLAVVETILFPVLLCLLRCSCLPSSQGYFLCKSWVFESTRIYSLPMGYFDFCHYWPCTSLSIHLCK